MLSILSIIDSSEKSEILRIMDSVRPLLLDQTPLIWKYPHITWHSAKEYQNNILEKSLQDLSTSWERTKIRVTGIGMFTGKTQVLYLPVIKTPSLVQMHKQIFKVSKPISKQPSKYFQPEIWIHHITIISDPDEQRSIPDAIHVLSDMKVDFEVEINNIALGKYTGDTAEILFEIPFSK